MLPSPHDPADEDIEGLPPEQYAKCGSCGKVKRINAFSWNRRRGERIRHAQCVTCKVQAYILRKLRGTDTFREGEGMPIAEIAKRLGISRPAAFAIEKRALKKVRAEIARQVSKGDETWALYGEEHGLKVQDMG